MVLQEHQLHVCDQNVQDYPVLNILKKKKKKALTPIRKQKRISASSNYSDLYVSRMRKGTRTLKKLCKFDIDVSTITNLVSAVAEMERTSKDKLEQLLKEADVSGE